MSIGDAGAPGVPVSPPSPGGAGIGGGTSAYIDEYIPKNSKNIILLKIFIICVLFDNFTLNGHTFVRNYFYEINIF